MGKAVKGMLGIPHLNGKGESNITKTNKFYSHFWNCVSVQTFFYLTVFQMMKNFLKIF